MLKQEFPEGALTAGSRWGRHNVSNCNSTHGFEDQILYLSKGCKLNLMPKSQSILLSCCITLYTIGTWNFASVHAPRCFIFDNIEHFGICVTPESFQVSPSGCCAICQRGCLMHLTCSQPSAWNRNWDLYWKRGKGKSWVVASFFFFPAGCYIMQDLSKILSGL